jgi:hypothetical protein
LLPLAGADVRIVPGGQCVKLPESLS